MTYLADKSALARIHHPLAARRLTELTDSDQIVTCGVIDLELLYSARTAAEFEQVLIGRSGYHRIPINEDTFDQAIAIQQLLAERGQHRRPMPDLLIAAAALLNDVVVLHYDHDFDLIAEVCELRHEWIVPRGSID